MSDETCPPHLWERSGPDETDWICAFCHRHWIDHVPHPDPEPGAA